MHSPEYFQWCLQRLTPCQYAVYCACQILGCIETTREGIAQIISCSPRSLRLHLAELQRKGFVLYDSDGKLGVAILWVRENPEQAVPRRDRLIADRFAIRLKGPDGKLHTIKRGKVTAFCKRHELNRTAIYGLLDGKQQEHRGWRVG